MHSVEATVVTPVTPSNFSKHIERATVINKIKIFLVQHKISKSTFAFRNNIAPCSLTRLLNGSGYCTTRTLNKIADGLGIGVVDLIRVQGDYKDTEILRFYHKFEILNRLPAEHQDLIAYVLRKLWEIK